MSTMEKEVARYTWLTTEQFGLMAGGVSRVTVRQWIRQRRVRANLVIEIRDRRLRKGRIRLSAGTNNRKLRKPRKATCIAEKHLDNEANIGVVWCKRRRRLFRYCKECKRAANRESMRRRRSAA